MMALGHFMMTLEPLFYVALATIAIGNGLFLPSLPSQIRRSVRSLAIRAPAAPTTSTTSA